MSLRTKVFSAFVGASLLLSTTMVSAQPQKEVKVLKKLQSIQIPSYKSQIIPL
jgi:hypothetical protein